MHGDSASDHIQALILSITRLQPVASLKASRDTTTRKLTTPNSLQFTAGRTGTLNAMPDITTLPHSSSASIQKEDREPWVVNFPDQPGPKGVHRKNTNYIRTTKYTVFSFIPLNLYNQFKRFYNLYFLLAAISVFLPGGDTLSPVTQIFPLVLVLGVNAIKELLEDYFRGRADRAANNTPVTIIRNGKKMEIHSRDVNTGDIIVVTKNHKFPVDAVLVSSSHEDGTCFIQTAELDGETSLKRRGAVPELAMLRSEQEVGTLRGFIECEQPNQRLGEFEGRLTIQGNTRTSRSSQKSTPVYPLSLNQLLFRGATLRNTEYAYGIVVYTGVDTKIMMNFNKGKVKMSTLEKKMNYLILAAFAYNFFLLVTSAVFSIVRGSAIYYKELARRDAGILQPLNYSIEWYLGPSSTPGAYTSLKIVISFFAMYTYVIPISLFVSIEIVRLLQVVFMNWDEKMAVEQEDADGIRSLQHMKANNSNLNEDLALVEYVFSDKTGTLTQNLMKLSNWYVGNTDYHEMDTPGVMGRALNDSAVVGEDRTRLGLFARCIGLCNTVLPQRDDKSGELVYEAQSPDESALLQGLAGDEVILRSRTKQTVVLNVFGKDEVWEHLQLMDFTSDRKRMSVVVRSPVDNKLYLFCKGADNMVLARLSRDERVNPSSRLHEAQAALDHYSDFGLRTLVVAYKSISEGEFTAFKTDYDAAERALNERTEKIAAACEKIEKELIYLGCTAIEDKLQDLVPETLEYLLRCGIKVWLLTGDKQETAINISMSSRLIQPDMVLRIVSGSNKKEVKASLDKIKNDMASQVDGRRNALVIKGEILALVYDAKFELELLEIGKQCAAVVCARMAPLQKAMVVDLVKQNVKTVTLAIGDGANDVSMIQAANIGVGIMGKEGNQAVRAADYAFGEFRFLKRLLVVHGRYSFERLAGLIYYSFYKNIAFITIQWWFGFVSGWSAQIVMEQIFFTFYNVVFTSLYPIVFAIFERDVPEEKLDSYPELFKEIRRGLYWNWNKVAEEIGSAVWHSLVIFGSVYFINSEGNLDFKGRANGYWVQCYLFSTPLLITVVAKSLTQTRHFIWITAAVVAVSMLLNTLTMVVVTALGYTEVGTFQLDHVIPAYYLCLLLLPTMCLLPDLGFTYLKRAFRPSDADIIAEEAYVVQKRRGAKKEQLERLEPAATEMRQIRE
ncbi:hypothetical protein SmJEL517_g05073 [Synchytrium microbalum]|uniref:Phospholipid-transporting ATPase n=1 Tax=Synchytrium microbalum TaxID=1806994 RepID=A0A507BWX0_9FUNG|nr:uncharacterized protein SmJEL517_g05073 [Synchytrium microbalum]TPX31648.1 hypothetical protein SmJEL517_g05073 [Synchytrium microbalum]